MKKLFISIVAIYIASFLSAQDKTCDAAMMEDLQQMSAEMKDATFLKDFNVHIEKSSPSSQNPEQRYSIFLSKNTLYRFALKSSSKYNSKANLTLSKSPDSPYSEDNVLQSISNSADKQFVYFDYLITENGAYNLKINFENGSEGCALLVIYFIRYIEPCNK